MANLIALKPKPEDAPPKSAQRGTRMFRRADVMHGLKKLAHYARRNLEVAEQEERWADADIQRARLRAFDLVRDSLFCIPVFANPEKVEEEPRDSGRHPEGENSRSEVEGEACQSGGEANRPNTESAS